MTFKYKITLFTPTYNRAYILDTLYRSVQRQTFRDFEWIIIDDGSTDNTQEIVAQWIEDGNDFPILLGFNILLFIWSWSVIVIVK